MLAARDLDPRSAEHHRRQLLRESDDLLGEIELLRLHGRRELPDPLRRGLWAFQLRAGRADPNLPTSVRTAHNLVFALQQRLMAANPRRPDSGAHPGRPAGMPAVTPIRPGIEWKLLVLPPHPGADRQASWLELIEAAVERSFDRWAYANFHACRAVKAHRNVPAALAVMRVAWNNYWELSREAAHIAESVKGRP
ncbi:MAG TPA: hypothetical protein VF160_13235 [Candidatus Dormibacteraeota bacterium]